MNGSGKAMLDEYSSGIRCFYSSSSMQSQIMIVLIWVPSCIVITKIKRNV